MTELLERGNCHGLQTLSENEQETAPDRFQLFWREWRMNGSGTNHSHRSPNCLAGLAKLRQWLNTNAGETQELDPETL